MSHTIHRSLACLFFLPRCWKSLDITSLNTSYPSWPGFLYQVGEEGWNICFFLRNGMFDTLFICRHIYSQEEALLYHRTLSAKPQKLTVCFPTSAREGTAKSVNTTQHSFHLLPWIQVPHNTGRMLHRVTPSNSKKSISPGGAVKHSFPHPFWPSAKWSSLKKINPTNNLSLFVS